MNEHKIRNKLKDIHYEQNSKRNRTLKNKKEVCEYLKSKQSKNKNNERNKHR